jgi:hypothetical protein
MRISPDLPLATKTDMRLSFLIFSLAMGLGVVIAYDFDAREFSSRALQTSSASLRLSRRAQEIQDLVTARNLIDSILEQRSIFSKKSKKVLQPVQGTAGTQQKAASAELQKWSTATVNTKKALAALQKTKPASTWEKKKVDMDLKRCLAFNEEGAAHFRAIAMASSDPARQRKPPTPPCVYHSKGSFSNLPAR